MLRGWERASRATGAADSVYPGSKVLRTANGRRHIISPTPHGHIEVLQTNEGGFLVSAERPPRREPSADHVDITPELHQHLTTLGLTPWKFVDRGSDIADVITSLEGGDGNSRQAMPFSPMCLPPPIQRELWGDIRIRAAEQCAALISSQRPSAPCVQLVGLRGIGRRTIAASMGLWGYRCIGELPLGRLAIPRILTTPGETIADTLAAACEAMQENDLLVITDGEMIARLDEITREQVLRELSRLPHALLVTCPSACSAQPVVSLGIPGLNIDEAQGWIAWEYPHVNFVGTATELAIQTAKSEAGILPGRLQHVIDLAQALIKVQVNPPSNDENMEDCSHELDSNEIVLAPDEIAAAAALLKQVGKPVQ